MSNTYCKACKITSNGLHIKCPRCGLACDGSEGQAMSDSATAAKLNGECAEEQKNNKSKGGN